MVLAAIAVVFAQAPGQERFRPEGMKVTPLEMVEDQLATVWMRTPAGLVRFDGSRYLQVGPESGYDGGVPTAIAAMDSGAIVVASSSGIWRLADGAFRRITDIPVTRMAVDGAWIVVFAPKPSLVRYVDGQTTVKPIDVPIPDARPHRGFGGLSYVAGGKACTLSFDDSGNPKLEHTALPPNFQRATELWRVSADRMLAVEPGAHAWLSATNRNSWRTDRINPWTTRHTLVSSASMVRAILWKPGLVSEVNPQAPNGSTVFYSIHSQSAVRSVLAGRNGETYVGFEDTGIARIHTVSAVVSWDSSEGISGESVRSFDVDSLEDGVADDRRDLYRARDSLLRRDVWFLYLDTAARYHSRASDVLAA